MEQTTLTRVDLIDYIYEEVGLSRNECADLLETTLEHISDSLVRGEQVKLSSFGTFTVLQKNARMGRNPKTREPAVIPPLRAVSFRASYNMKNRVMLGNRTD